MNSGDEDDDYIMPPEVNTNSLKRPPKPAHLVAPPLSPPARPPIPEPGSRPLPATPGASAAEELTSLNVVASKDEKPKFCQNPKCANAYDVICIRCYQSFCYRCSKSACRVAKGRKHEVKDFVEYLEEQRKRYSKWRTAKENRSINLDHEIRALSLKIKGIGQELANSSSLTAAANGKQTISILTQQLQIASKLSIELKDIHSVLSQYESLVPGLSDAAFMKLASELTFQDTLRRYKKYHLGTFDTMLMMTSKYVATGVNGESILATTNRAVELFNATATHPLATIPLIGQVFSYQNYRDEIYVMVALGDAGDQVIVYDQLYSKTRQWQIPYKVSDIAVNNDRVYLAAMDDRKSTPFIHVYRTDNSFSHKFSEGFGSKLKSHSLPDIILTANYNDDRVFGVNGVTREILWSVEIVKPCSITLDEYEMVWVWSEFEQNVAIFDDKGNKRQDVDHPKFTGIGDVNSICVKSERLWVAYDGGLRRFHIIYD